MHLNPFFSSCFRGQAGAATSSLTSTSSGDNITLPPLFVPDGSLIPGSHCECRSGPGSEDCMCHGAGLLAIPGNLSSTLRTL